MPLRVPPPLGVLRLRLDNAEGSCGDHAGRQKLRELVGDLVDTFGGEDFSVEEILRVARDAELETAIRGLLFASELPGFVTSPVVVSRLRDADYETPRFQISMHVRNDEPVAGTVRMVVSISDVAPTIVGRPMPIPGKVLDRTRAHL